MAIPCRSAASCICTVASSFAGRCSGTTFADRQNLLADFVLHGRESILQRRNFRIDQLKRVEQRIVEQKFDMRRQAERDFEVVLRVF